MLVSALIILALPLLAFVVQIFFGRRIPRQGDWVSTGALCLTIVPALYILFKLLAQDNPDFRLEVSWPWFNAGELGIAFGITIDNVTGVMLVVVTVVGSLVHLFSVGYMSGDPLYSRFFAYLSLFSFSMLGLVLANNLLVLYIFWELVGICSYLLIGFWFNRPAAAAAGKKAFITTRIGDVGMFIGILTIFTVVGSFNFNDAFAAVASGKLAGFALTLAGAGLFVGAVGKSAQFPLHVWLPDAMEGPTPVSALIHAATMVVAGVYMVARLYLLLNAQVLIFIAYLGAFTALFAATIAVTQRDIKRVLAYSTVSQLGYMMLGLGVGGFTAGLFHLWTHAFFKALLFLAAGSIIHALHTQDMWEMGGLKSKMPITFATLLAGALALVGFPFFSGFYSKDAILAQAYEFAHVYPSHLLPFVMGMLAVGFTAFYMFKMLAVVFFGAPRDKEKHEHARESPLCILIPLVLLGFLALSSGWGGWFEELIRKPELKDYAVSSVAEVSNLAGANSGADLAREELAETAAGHGIVVVFSLLMLAAGGALAAVIYFLRRIKAEDMAQRFSGLHRLLYQKYYLDEVYQFLLINPLLAFNQAIRWFDERIIDGAVNGLAFITRKVADFDALFDNLVVDGAVNGTANLVLATGAVLRRVQTGKLQNYLTLVLIGIFLLFILAVF